MRERLIKTRPTPAAKDYATMAVVFCLFIGAAALWHWWWVEPRDRAMRGAMDCLNAQGLEMNEDNWEHCWNETVVRLNREGR